MREHTPVLGEMPCGYSRAAGEVALVSYSVGSYGVLIWVGIGMVSTLHWYQVLFLSWHAGVGMAKLHVAVTKMDSSQNGWGPWS